MKVAQAIPEGVRPSGRRAQAATGVGALILGAILVLSLGAAVWDYIQPGGPSWLLEQGASRPYIGSTGLLAMEEAGIPLPLPGDLVVMFAAHRAARTIPVLVLVWLLLMAATLIGSALLFGIARRWGRGLSEGRVGRALHLNPERLAKVESWFERRGLWVVLLGRFVPGARVPITVAAATFGLSLRVFMVAVAASAAVWLLIFMALGLTLGPKVDELVRGHRTSSLIVPAIVAAAFFGYLGFRLVRTRSRGRPSPT